MFIDSKTLTFLEDLSRLRIDSAQRENAMKELETAALFLSDIKNTGTGDIDALALDTSIQGRYREDVSVPPPDRARILKNAMEHNEEYFKVPKTLE